MINFQKVDRFFELLIAEILSVIIFSCIFLIVVAMADNLHLGSDWIRLLYGFAGISVANEARLFVKRLAK